MNKICPSFNEGRGIVMVGFLPLIMVLLPMLIVTGRNKTTVYENNAKIIKLLTDICYLDKN